MSRLATLDERIVGILLKAPNNRLPKYVIKKKLKVDRETINPIIQELKERFIVDVETEFVETENEVRKKIKYLRLLK